MTFKSFLLKSNKLKLMIFQMILRKIEIYYDRFHGLDFLSVMKAKQLRLDENLVYRPSPSGDKFLYNVLKDLNIKEHDSILDIGCAKGSAIRMMNKFSFSRIDGLELSESLANIAKSNFLKLKFNKTKIYRVNATEFKLYYNYNYYYLYNPFPSSVMENVIEKINNTNAKKEIKYIIYNNPFCNEVLLQNGFKKIKEYPDKWGNGIYLYSNEHVF